MSPSMGPPPGRSAQPNDLVCWPPPCQGRRRCRPRPRLWQPTAPRWSPLVGGCQNPSRTPTPTCVGVVTGGDAGGSPMGQPTGRDRLLALVSAGQLATGLLARWLGCGDVAPMTCCGCTAPTMRSAVTCSSRAPPCLPGVDAAYPGRRDCCGGAAAEPACQPSLGRFGGNPGRWLSGRATGAPAAAAIGLGRC
jgi:hypothetical protein